LQAVLLVLFLATSRLLITVTDMSGCVGSNMRSMFEVFDERTARGVDRVMAGSFWDPSPAHGSAADDTAADASSHQVAAVICLADWVAG
jgi:hypothetical protein